MLDRPLENVTYKPKRISKINILEILRYEKRKKLLWYFQCNRCLCVLDLYWTPMFTLSSRYPLQALTLKFKCSIVLRAMLKLNAYLSKTIYAHVKCSGFQLLII